MQTKPITPRIRDGVVHGAARLLGYNTAPLAGEDEYESRPRNTLSKDQASTPDPGVESAKETVNRWRKQVSLLLDTITAWISEDGAAGSSIEFDMNHRGNVNSVLQVKGAEKSPIQLDHQNLADMRLTIGGSAKAPSNP